MTNKEAIMILESIQPSCGGKYSFSESEIYEAIDMAIEALEAQNAVIHMDLPKISEDDIKKMLTKMNHQQQLEWIVDGTIPNSSGKDTNVPSKDTIYRQDAIDAVTSSVMEWDEIYAQDLNVRISEAIQQMPSAQPERTCVNCGRTANNGGWYADGGTRCPIEEHYALPKDGFCHLWEKRNITDDDYPERRTDERHN